MTDTVKGSCLCQKVTFEIRGPFEHFFLCHCTRCQKGSGSAHAANLFSSSAVITWITGQSELKAYTVRETQHQVSFCRNCGTHLPNIQMDGKLLVVPAGCLDTPIQKRPDAHICLDDKASWDEALEKITKYGGFPG